ncbi:MULTISPECIES: periplasmic heavy metal sensor [unclassified Shimia]|uniref:periplasmic heavy metal sensor n=1 Tax=unclassified Shimia TaxID=2630038 RepID=UPI0031096885
MTQETMPKGKKRGLLRGLLIGSLALNLLIVGLVGGAIFNFKHAGGPSTTPDRFSAPFIRALSFEDKREVGRAIRKSYRNADIDRAADRLLYATALEQLRQSPFDVDALAATVAALDGASRLRRDLARDSFMAQVNAMSDTERAAYADRFEEALKRGHKDGRDKGAPGKKQP